MEAVEEEFSKWLICHIKKEGIMEYNAAEEYELKKY